MTKTDWQNFFKTKASTFLTSTVLTLLPTGHDGSDRDRRRESGPTDRRLGHLEDGE